jgi:predicted transcriptional regulator
LQRRRNSGIDIDIKLAAYGSATMATEQLLLRLPDHLARRFKQVVPARQRSAFVRQLLEQALPAADSDNDPLYLAALAAEQDTKLGEEMAEWEAATINDGLTEAPPSKRPV